MIKNLRFVLMSMLMLLAGAAFAQTEFDFDTNGATMFGLPGESSNDSHDGDITEAKSATVGNFTVTVSAAAEGVSNANRIWNSAPKLRMYSGTLTIASTGASIKNVVFTLAPQASKAKWGAANSASTGTIDAEAKTSVTWTGDASEVVFTIAANTQISKITINGEGGGEVTPPTPEVKSVTVTEALSIIDGLDNGTITSDTYQVKGYVISVTEISTTYGNATFIMADDRSATAGLTVFRVKGFNGADITDENLLKVGDEVVVEGHLQKYVKNDVVTPEIAQTDGKIISVNGQTSGGDTPVEDVEKAANIAALKAIAEGKTVELTLTNAQVLYVNVYNNTKELFVRDDSGAADLYELGIEAEAGQVLNGTIIGKRGKRSGFTNALLKVESTNAATVTVGAKQDVAPVEISAIDEATYDAYGCDLVKLVGVKVSEDFKKALSDGDELALYDRFQTGLLSGLDVNAEYDITGLIYDGGATYGTELVVTALTQVGGNPPVDQPATPVASIEALLALESPSANLELTLTDAKVLFNDGNYIYVRENGKALCFYKVDAVKDLFKNNAIVNGVIDVDYEVYNNMPEVKANKNTTAEDLAVQESEEAAEPVQTTLAEVATGAHVCDLVTLQATMVKEVTYKEDGETVSSTTYYLQDGDTKLLCVNNGKGLNKIEEGTFITATGIVNTNKDGYQVKLTKTVPESTDIIDVNRETVNNNHIFNLAGQRIEKAQRGINIIGGKKLMVK